MGCNNSSQSCHPLPIFLIIDHFPASVASTPLSPMRLSPLTLGYDQSSDKFEEATPNNNTKLPKSAKKITFKRAIREIAILTTEGLVTGVVRSLTKIKQSKSQISTTTNDDSIQPSLYPDYEISYILEVLLKCGGVVNVSMATKPSSDADCQIFLLGVLGKSWK